VAVAVAVGGVGAQTVFSTVVSTVTLRGGTVFGAACSLLPPVRPTGTPMRNPRRTLISTPTASTASSNHANSAFLDAV
jgi:hypothetical protein